MYGAQGGSYYNGNGGMGGFASGIINIMQKTTGFIFIGGEGTANPSDGEQKGGYNGGGNGQKRTSGYQTYGAGGGGATDIRIIGDSFNDRIIVAGGGGGSGHGSGETGQNSYSYNNKGGSGGGIEGGIGTVNNDWIIWTAYNPSTQHNVGKGSRRDYRTDPGFGYGGNNTYIGSSNAAAAGGGGGWFGGDAAGALGFSGAGGSGYVLTSSSNKPQGYRTFSPDYYFNYAELISGVRQGNGMAQIKVISKLYGDNFVSCARQNVYNLKLLLFILIDINPSN